jgi:GWxTD domain-containing protein
VRLEVYYRFYNSGLTFEEVDNKLVAEYEVAVYVDGKKGKQVARDRRSHQVVVADKNASRSMYDYRNSQFNFELEPRKYKVRCVLTDKKGEKSVTREFKVNLQKFDNKQPKASDVEFVQSTGTRSEDASVFDKGTLVVVPSVTRAYGGDEDTRMLYYFEIYRGTDSLEKVVVETRIRHFGKGMVYRDTLTTELTEAVHRQLREISLVDFPPGDYEMELYLRGRRNKKLDLIRPTFSVLWSMEGLIKHDFKTAVSQLNYIAEPGELNALKDAKTTEERLEAFNAFWAARDITVGTKRNEVREEFYRRITTANRRFTVLNRDGWRSDRGRILIQHGEPDQIDDVPMSLSSFPYQIWHYYQIGRYRRFAFVDENNDGDYRLQYPYDGLNQTPDF